MLKDVKSIKEVVLDGDTLTLEQLIAICRYGAKVSIAPAAVDKIKASRAIVDEIVEHERPVYGITTGFASLARSAYLKKIRHSFRKIWCGLIAAAMVNPFPKK